MALCAGKLLSSGGFSQPSSDGLLKVLFDHLSVQERTPTEDAGTRLEFNDINLDFAQNETD